MTQQNNIVALRDTLFETLRSLNDKDKPMEIERAKAICEVSQTIINSAKVEIDHLRITGGTGSGFIPDATRLPGNSGVTKPEPGRTVHRLR